MQISKRGVGFNFLGETSGPLTIRFDSHAMCLFEDTYGETWPPQDPKETKLLCALIFAGLRGGGLRKLTFEGACGIYDRFRASGGDTAALYKAVGEALVNAEALVYNFFDDEERERREAEAEEKVAKARALANDGATPVQDEEAGAPSS